MTHCRCAALLLLAASLPIASAADPVPRIIFPAPTVAAPAEAPYVRPPSAEDPLIDALTKGNIDDAVRFLNAGYTAASAKLAGPTEPPYNIDRDPCLDFQRVTSAVLKLSVFRLFPDLNEPSGENKEARAKLAKILGEEGNLMLNRRPFGPEALLQTAARLTDPVLRLLLFQAASRSVESTAEAAKIIADPDSSPAALLVAAAWEAEMARHPKRVYEVLTRAQALPSAGPWLGWIDSALLSLKANTTLSGLDPAPAEKAATWLAAEALKNGRPIGDRLAMAMRQLNIPGAPPPSASHPARPQPVMPRTYYGAASSPDAIVLNAPGAGMPQPEVLPVRPPPPPDDPARVTLATMVRDGRGEEVARLLMNAVRKAVTGASQKDRVANDSIAAAAGIAVTLKIEDALLAAAEPPAGSVDWEVRRTDAMLLMKLRGGPAALPLLRTLHAERPDDLPVIADLYATLPVDEKEAWLGRLEKGDMSLDEAADLIAGAKLDQPQTDRDAAMALGLARMLGRVPPSSDPSRDLAWLGQWCYRFFYNYRMDVGKALRDRGRAGSDAAARLRTDRSLAYRRESIKELAAVMLSHPQTSPSAFRVLNEAKESFESDPLEMDAWLATMLRTSLKHWDWPIYENKPQPKPESANFFPRVDILAIHCKHGERDNGVASGQAARELLALRLNLGVVPPVLDAGGREELLSGSGPAADALHRMVDIVFTGGSEKLQLWLNDDTVGDGASRRAQFDALLLLVQLSGRQDLLGLLEDVVTSRAVAKSRSPDPDMSSLAAVILLYRDSGSRVAALSRAAQKLLGPEESWPLFAELGQGERVIGGYARSSFGGLLSVLQAGGVAGDMTVDRFLCANGLQKIFYEHIDEAVSFEGRTVADFIQSGIFANDAAALPLRRAFFQSLRRREPTLAGLARLMEVEGDERMWARLTVAVQHGDDALAAKELEANAATISTWTPEQRKEFAALIADYFPQAMKASEEPAAKLLSASHDAGTDELRKAARQWLEKGVGEQPDRPALTPVILGFIPADPALAAKLWAAWLRADAEFSPDMLSYYADNFRHELFSSQGIGLPELAGFLNALALEPGGELGKPWSGEMGHDLGERFAAILALRSAELAQVSTPKPTAAGAREFAAYLAKERPRAATAVAALIGQFYANTTRPYDGPLPKPGAEADALIVWARHDLGSTTELLGDVAIVGLLMEHLDKLEPAQKEELATSVRRLAVAAEVPAVERLALLDTLGSQLSGLLDFPGMSGALAEATIEALPAEVKERGGRIGALLQALGKCASLSPEAAGKLYLKAKGPAAKDKHESPWSFENMTLDLDLLRLAVRSGDAPFIRGALNDRSAGTHHFGPDPRDRLDLAILLWQRNLPQAALEFVAPPERFHRYATPEPENRGPDWMNQEMPPFSREMEQSLPGWLAAIFDPQQRYRVECVISAHPDATGDAAPSVPLRERLEKLIARFPVEGPQVRAARMETLAALVSRPECGREALPLEQAIAAMVTAPEAQGLAGNPPANEPKESAELRTFRLLERSLLLPVQARGDTSALLAELKRLDEGAAADARTAAAAATDAGSNRGFGSGRGVRGNGGGGGGFRRPDGSAYLENLIFRHGAWLLRSIVDLPQDQRLRVVAVLDRLFATAVDPQRKEVRENALLLVDLAHSAAADGAGFDAWTGSLQPALRSSYDTNRSAGSGPFAMLNRPAWRSPEFADSRRALLRSLLADPASAARLPARTYERESELLRLPFTAEDIVAVTGQPLSGGR